MYYTDEPIWFLVEAFGFFREIQMAMTDSL